MRQPLIVKEEEEEEGFLIYISTLILSIVPPLIGPEGEEEEEEEDEGRETNSLHYSDSQEPPIYFNSKVPLGSYTYMYEYFSVYIYTQISMHMYAWSLDFLVKPQPEWASTNGGEGMALEV